MPDNRHPASVIRVEPGDCLEVMARLKAEGVRVQACVTDPPYHLTSVVKRFGRPDSAPAKSNGPSGVYGRAAGGFMGQRWDGGDIAFRPETWALVYDLLPPGGHLVAFSGARTYHRMATAIEAAGFELRDMLADLVASDTHVRAFVSSLNAEQAAAFRRCIEESGFGGMLAWLFGSGFPKSHDASKAIDKHLGAARAKVRHQNPRNPKVIEGGHGIAGGDRPWMAQARAEGFVELDGPEPVTEEARQWQGWGTALKPAHEPICLARKPLAGGSVAANLLAHGAGAINVDGGRIEAEGPTGWGGAAAGGGTWNAETCGLAKDGAPRPVEGRWPANVVHDGSGEVVAAFPATQSTPPGNIKPSATTDGIYGAYGQRSLAGHTDSGSAARFFYSAKADAEDRWGSRHPTVKPVALMRWLVRLVTPPGGTVLDPFAGSGTTGVACLAEGLGGLLIEREADYIADIRARLDHYRGEGRHSLAAKARRKTPEGDLPLFGGTEDGEGGP